MSTLVKIYKATSLADAALVKSDLEEAGIPVLDRPAGNPVTAGDGIYALPPFINALFVAAEQSEQAQAIIARYVSEVEAAPAEIAPTEEPEDDYVPANRRWYVRVAKVFLWLFILSMLAGVLLLIYSVIDGSLHW